MSRSAGSFRLVQIAAGYAPHDAITAEMEIIADFVRAERAGPFTSAITVAEQIPPGSRGACSRLKDLRLKGRDLVVLHYGMTLEGLERIALWPGPKALVYHNITPADFYRSYDPVTAGRLLRARNELPAVVAACDMIFAVSEFNARELRAAGAENVLLKPVLYPAERVKTPEANNSIDAPVSKQAVRDRRSPYRLLFVGRFAPNKNHMGLLKIVALLKERLPIRLTCVGSAGGAMDDYVNDLRKVAVDFGIADDIEFVLDADNARLAAFYESADLFLCATRHEGFCVPLLEAMAAGVPVFARQADDTAVAETMNGAGLGFRPPRTAEDYSNLARTVELLLTDDPLRARIVAGQYRRLESYQPEAILADFFRSLNRIVS